MHQKHQHIFNVMIIITSLIISLLPKETSAYSSYAGSCNAGGGVGATHLGDDTGPLSKSGFEVLIDDVKLVEGTSQTIAISNDGTTESSHKLTIRSDGSSNKKFRGFLIRVSSNDNTNNDIDMPHYLSIYDGYENVVQIITDSLCRGSAAGATHRNNNQKDEISTALSFTSPVDALVEVTMVTENLGEGNDGWYYSGFDVTVVEAAAEEQESEEPSASPTVTKSISSVPPTAIKSDESNTTTSSSPSLTPSLTPSMISSLDPTSMNPTTSPSMPPTTMNQGVVVTTPSPTSDSFMVSCVYSFVLSGMGALFVLIMDII